MKITKFGHCCLLIEENGLRILTDPGIFSTSQNEVTNIHVILITHEHRDHYHSESVKAVMARNPQATIFTNRGVEKLLVKDGIPFKLLEHGATETVEGILIEAMGEAHAPIYPPMIPDVVNTGYFIAKKVWYPGDGFFDPGRTPDILALPVSAPWMHIREALDYMKALKPKIVLPVHDGFLKEGGVFHRLPGMVAKEIGAEFRAISEGEIEI